MTLSLIISYRQSTKFRRGKKLSVFQVLLHGNTGPNRISCAHVSRSSNCMLLMRFICEMQMSSKHLRPGNGGHVLAAPGPRRRHSILTFWQRLLDHKFDSRSFQRHGLPSSMHLPSRTSSNIFPCALFHPKLRKDLRSRLRACLGKITIYQEQRQIFKGLCIAKLEFTRWWSMQF